MNKDRAKGTMDELVGSAKRKAGKITGNTRLQVAGMAQQAKGKVENAVGKAKDAIRTAVQSAEVHVDTHLKLDLQYPKAALKSNRSK